MAQPTERGSEQARPTAGAAATVPKRRASLTSRAIALAVVLLVLTISYASSLRIYVAQAREISTTRAEIADRQAKIADLQSELAQWDDPAYVKQQARDRLGWVVPGETGYRVVGPDGKPLGGGAEMTQPAATPQPPLAWWQRLWGSVQTADRPTPVKKSTKPKQRKPITVDTKPKGAPRSSASAAPR